MIFTDFIRLVSKLSFRDAKQFTGLNHCQARGQKALYFHFNASMTALNLIKLQDRLQRTFNQRHVISIAS